MVPHVNIPVLEVFHTDKLKFSFSLHKNLVYMLCNFLASNSLLRSNTLGVTIQTKQIRIMVEIIPIYLNDYMPNQNNLPFQSIFKKYAKSCVRGA